MIELPVAQAPESPSASQQMQVMIKPSTEDADAPTTGYQIDTDPVVNGPDATVVKLKRNNIATNAAATVVEESKNGHIRPA